MANKNDVKLLKEAFCDFFAKLLPHFTDPDQLIRKKWHHFRDFLLDESHNPLDIFLFAQKLQFQVSSPDRIKMNNIQPKLVQEPSRIQTQVLHQKDFPTSPFDLEAIPIYATPQQNRRQLGKLPTEAHGNLVLMRRQKNNKAENMQTDDIDKFNLKIDLADSIEEKIVKYDAEDIAGCIKFDIKGSPKSNKTFPNMHMGHHKHTFGQDVKNVLLAEVTEALNLFRKHGTTLGCVYDKSFEINTGGISEEIQHFQSRFAQEQQQRMANIDTQQLQRNMAFKECSMYSQNRQHPLQRIEQALMQFQLPLKPPQTAQYLQLPQQGYQGRREGKRNTGKKVYLQ